MAERKTEAKVAVVTGASRGLGRAVAVALGRRGWRVALAARSSEPLLDAAHAVEAAGGVALAVPCDVGRPRDVEDLARRAEETLGPIQAWVNNAGLAGPYGPTVDLPHEAFETVTRTNVLGTYYGSVTALRRMLPRRAGVLINLLGRGDKGPVKFQNAYGASKTWVRSFTLALAKEHEDDGVRIHALNPGLVETELLRDVTVVEGHEDDLKPFATIVGMWGRTPEEAAEPIAALAAGERKAPVEVQSLGPRRIVEGAVRLGLRALTGRARRPDIRVTRIPPERSRN